MLIKVFLMCFLVGATQAPQKELFLIHGSPGSAEVYRHYLEDPDLKQIFRLTSVDRPGFGTKKASPLYTLKEQADLIVKDLPPSNHRICMGHSYGGSLCLYLLKFYPSHFNGGFLISAPSDSHRKIRRWYNGVAHWKLVQWILPQSLVHSNREMLNLKRDLSSLEDLADVHQEIHLIHGENDGLVPVQDSDLLWEKIKDLNPNNSYTRLPQKGHFVLWQNFKKIKKLILDAFGLEA